MLPEPNLLPSLLRRSAAKGSHRKLPIVCARDPCSEALAEIRYDAWNWTLFGRNHRQQFFQRPTRSAALRPACAGASESRSRVLLTSILESLQRLHEVVCCCSECNVCCWQSIKSYDTVQQGRGLLSVFGPWGKRGGSQRKVKHVRIRSQAPLLWKLEFGPFLAILYSI